MAVATLATGEWLRAPSRGLALAAIGLLLLAAVLGRRRWLALPLLLVALLLGHAEWTLERLERGWIAAREARIERASAGLQDELREARLVADTLARRALALADLPREDGFAAAAALARGPAIESGVVVFDSLAAARVWGGRFRLTPAARGDSVGVLLTPYYAVMEVRRHGADGRTALAAVLLGTGPAVPDPEGSLAYRFRERTEVGMRILAPRQAPDISDVFDYEQPTAAGTRVLFSVQFVPPSQLDALVRARDTGARRVSWALLTTLLAAVWLVPAGLSRLALALLPIGLAIRAPLGTVLGLGGLFDPAVFRSGILGPVSSAAGPLALAGTVLLLTGALVWERARARRVPGVVAGVILLLGAPYLLADLGRGIVPPAAGVSIGLWLVWHLTLFLAAAGLVTLAVALLRDRRRPAEGWIAPVLAGGIALAAAVVGVLVWNASFGWPGWYTALWLPSLVLLTRPAARGPTMVGIGLVAGSAAALLAWGAEIEGRLKAARADMASLTEQADPRLQEQLRELGLTLRQAELPRSMPDLYAVWRASSLSEAGHPASLGLWTADGAPVIGVDLADMDLPPAVLAAMVREMPPGDSVSVQAIQREPAVHQVLLVRRDSAEVLSVALGPRTALVPPSRLGRLLGRPPSPSRLYRLTLSPTPSSGAPTSGLARWRREGWLALGERTITIAGVPRDVHGTVELGGSNAFVVRGALVVVLDLVVLAALWTLGNLLGGRPLRLPAWMPRLRSYEARLGAALSVFFLAPTLGFAGWGIGRLRAEGRETRDRMIEQSLRDVAPGNATLPAVDPDLSADLRARGDRVDADLALYRDAEWVAGSTGGLLEALGVLEPLLDHAAFHAIRLHGGAETWSEGPSRAVPTRIGYRAVRLSDYGAGVLAMPQAAVDPVLGDRQLDLAMLLLLSTLGGVAASLLAARIAARALARPVADLQAAAVTFGRGEEPPQPAGRPPLEFEPVFEAFQKMTADVRKAREARERVARIVAWGEMANQVAHEIKNPLTPMRLGVQHLRRVQEDGRTPIGPVLETTTARILAEIDRLDRIARSFSRFGVPASERGPLEIVRLPTVVRDVAELYRLGPEGAEISVEVDGAVPVKARADEVKEVLVNLLDNSRNARARNIRVRVAGTVVVVEDNGCGIRADLLPMIFEPRFSTSTSGSGLGLPIVKRLVESWGGKVEVESEEGEGTTVRLQLVPAGADGPGPAAPTREGSQRD